MPLARRRQLRYRLFAWFAASIALTTVTVVGVMVLVNQATGPPWRRDFHRVHVALARHLAQVWDQPEQVAAFARDLNQDLDTPVTISAVGGKILAQIGPECPRPRGVPVVRRGVTVGEITMCPPRSSQSVAWRPVLALGITLLMLWAAAGRLARWLASPLAEVARVAEAIGKGRLDTRVPLQRHNVGEVHVLAHAINDMAARIEKQIADQRELLAAVSHELRTPLGHMRLLTELARDAGAPDKICTDLDRELDEVDDLVGQLLATARLDFTAVTTQRLDATQLAIRALERAGADASALQVEAPGVAIQGDPTLLMRALANLLDNARRHGGRLEALRVREGAEQRVVFEVEDDGPGFAEGEMVRAFERFRAGANGRSHDGRSLGLGLHLVERIAQAHGGRAFAVNREEGGARVGIEVPADRQPA